MIQLPAPPVPFDLVPLYANICYLMLGIYGWEYLLSFSVEFAIVCGRLAFCPSLIPYVLGRISLLVHLGLITAAASPHAGSTSCLAGTIAISLSAGTALACSSTNFIIRTWVIWKNSGLVRVLLLFLALGQWILLVSDVASTRTVVINGVCGIAIDHPQIDAVTLFYTMFLDILVFVLLVMGLSGRRSKSPLETRLCTQGILYVAVAGLAYVPSMVLALLHSPAGPYFPANAGESVTYRCVYKTWLTGPVVIAVSTIASSRSVRSLRTLDTRDPSESLETDLALTTHITVQQDVP